MEQQTVGFFLSWFAHPSATGIALAIVFGIIWLFAYLPPLFKRYVLWLVLVVSAFFTLTAVAFVQIPLQIFVGKILSAFFSNETITRWLLLAAIPQILLSGLVQEGSCHVGIELPTDAVLVIVRPVALGDLEVLVRYGEAVVQQPDCQLVKSLAHASSSP